MSDEIQQGQEQNDAPENQAGAAEQTSGESPVAPAVASVDGSGPAADAASETPAPPAEGDAGDQGSASGDQPAQEQSQSPVEAAEETDVVSLARAKYEIEDEVTDGQVIEFLNGTAGEQLNLGDWSTELLLLVLQGKFRFPETELKNVIVVYRQRVEIPGAWNDQNVITYLRSGQEPKKTSTGAWLTDITRSNRIPAEWSTAELEAWAKGEVQAGGKSHDNGLAIELKARLGLKSEDSPKSVRKAYRNLSPEDKIQIAGAEASAPVVVEASSEETQQLQHARAAAAQIEKVEGLSTVNVAIIDDGLNRFIQATQPNRPISEIDALKAQRDLDNTFQYIIGLEPQAMVAGLERLKVVFKKQMVKGGVFDANNVFRFTHFMRTDTFQQQRHKGLLELFRIFFSDAKEARKQVDPKLLLQYQATDKIPLLMEYFQRVA